MKTLFKTYKIIALMLICSTTLYNCSSDENNQAEAPVLNLSLAHTNYAANFYQEGQTQALQIETNSSAPVAISIDGDPEALFYDPESNTIIWTKALPVGNTEYIIRATSGSAEATTNISIKNVFSGTFEGAYSNDSPVWVLEGIEVIFNTDGSLVHVLPSGDAFNGTYTMAAESEITFIYGDNDGDLTLYRGEFTYTDTQIPEISGDRYFNEISEATKSGTFQFTYQN